MIYAPDEVITLVNEVERRVTLFSNNFLMKVKKDISKEDPDMRLEFLLHDGSVMDYVKPMSDIIVPETVIFDLQTMSLIYKPISLTSCLSVFLNVVDNNSITGEEEEYSGMLTIWETAFKVRMKAFMVQRDLITGKKELVEDKNLFELIVEQMNTPLLKPYTYLFREPIIGN
jgi:hypothetical protein